ncbi:MAG: hypothetical protein ACN6O3_06660 [Comamonas sp.]
MSKTHQPPSTHTPETRVSTPAKQQPGDAGPNAKLPHEHDQSTDMTGGAEHPEMQRAYKDAKRGLPDTDARGKDGRPLGQKRPAP